MRCPRGPRGFDLGLAALVLLIGLAPASAGDWQPRVRMGGSAVSQRMLLNTFFAYQFHDPAPNLTFTNKSDDKTVINLSRHCTSDCSELTAPMLHMGIEERTLADFSLPPASIANLELFPLVGVAVTPVYNLAGAGQASNSQALALTPLVVARIFAGTIQYWDDAQIAASNPGWTSPGHHPITVVVRSDVAGEAHILRKALQGVPGGPGGFTNAWPLLWTP